MYRCGIILKNGTPIAQNFNTKEECEEWVLKQMEIEEIKKAIIVNKDNIKERYNPLNEIGE